MLLVGSQMDGNGSEGLLLWLCRLLVWSPWYVIHAAIHVLVVVSAVLVILVAMLYRWGYLHRLFIYLTERELSKVLNHVPVSIGRVDLSDAWRGRITGQDVILHSPNRHVWKWDSPCIARLGSVDISVSLLTVIDLLRPYLMTTPYLIDIYSIHLQDVQCFIEKRQPNIFNFHLLDESLDIPLPTTTSQHKSVPMDAPSVPISKMTQVAVEEEEKKQADLILSKLSSVANYNDSINQEEKKKNSSNSLQQTFLSQLKQWQSQLDDTHNEHGENNKNNGRILEVFLQQSQNQKNGLKVVKDVVKQHVDTILSSNKSPPKKEGYVAPKIDNFRIGRVILENVHIFTRDILLQSNTKATDATSIYKKPNISSGIEDPASGSVNTSGWQTPLYIQKYCISSAELCPPAFTTEESTGNPVLGLSIDNTVNILLKHLLGELAERNAGHVLGNAYSEIHTWVKSTIHKSTSNSDNFDNNNTPTVNHNISS